MKRLVGCAICGLLAGCMWSRTRMNDSGIVDRAKAIRPGVTRVDELPMSYQRYLINGIRRELGFGAVPVRLMLRAPKNPYGGG